MKIPKAQKRYCKTCKTSTDHKVDQYKAAGKRGPLSKGSKDRMQSRGKNSGHGNKGKLSKGPITKFKRTGVKVSKKTTLRYTCNTCKKASQQKQGFRAKKIELI